MSSWFFGNALKSQLISLLSTLETSTLLEDKLQSLETLKQLSLSNPLEIGEQVIPALCDKILGNNDMQMDLNVLHLSLDILINLMLPPSEAFDASQMQTHTDSQQLYYEHNMKHFMNSNQLNDRLNILIKLLSMKDFEIRYHIIQLITSLLLYKGHVIRSAVINIYGAINTLTELLSEELSSSGTPRHQAYDNSYNGIYIRNAMLILLTELCRNDSSIQKLIAFDGVYEKLFVIMDEEITKSIAKEEEENQNEQRDEDREMIESEYEENGMVVILDALKLLHALLESNVSNIKYFVEIKCVEQGLVPLWTKCLTRRFNGMKEQWFMVVGGFVDILVCVIYGLGHTVQMQNALGVAMDPLLQIIGDFSIPKDISLESTGLDESLLLKHKCCMVLRCLLHGHTVNQNRFLTSKVQVVSSEPSGRDEYHSNGTVTSQFAVIFFLKMSLGMLTVSPQPLHQLLSILSGSILSSFFFKNTKLQTMFLSYMLKATLAQTIQPQFTVSGKSPYEEFGEIMLRTLSIYQLQQRGFGDVNRFWMVCRIISYFFINNENAKILALEQAIVSIGNQVYLHDLIMNTLMASLPGETERSRYLEKKIPMSLLLILCHWCFNDKKVIHALFGLHKKAKKFFECLMEYAMQDEKEQVYQIGLASYLIALFLEYAPDVNPNKTNQDSNDKSWIRDVLSKQIGLEKFKSNLEALRQSSEYQTVFGIMNQVNQASKSKMQATTGIGSGNNNGNSENDLEQQYLIHELFQGLMNHTNSSNNFSDVKIVLLDRVWVQQFEKIYAGIDQRIISLLSVSGPQSRIMNRREPLESTTEELGKLYSGNARGDSISNVADPLKTNTSTKITNEQKSAEILPATDRILQSQKQLTDLQVENEQMKLKIKDMHIQLQQQKITNQEKEKANEREKMKAKENTEKNQMKSEYELKLNELRQQVMHANNQMNEWQEQNRVLQTKVEIQQKQLDNFKKTDINSDAFKKSESAYIDELKQKLDSLQKKYEDLTERNNDLLVYVGYLHDERDKMQQKIKELTGSDDIDSTITPRLSNDINSKDRDDFVMTNHLAEQ